MVNAYNNAGGNQGDTNVKQKFSKLFGDDDEDEYWWTSIPNINL